MATQHNNRVKRFLSLSTAVLLFTAACQHTTLPSGDSSPVADVPVQLQAAPRTASERSLPLVYWSEQKTGAEPMAIHVLRVDLHHRAYEVDAIIADDPDGDGPAEAALTDPLALARRSNAIAAVNANAFAGVIDAAGKRDSRWRDNLPVDIAGIAVHDGVTRSKGGDGSAIDVVFGIDERRRPYIGPAATGGALIEAVNAWSFKLFETDAAPQPDTPRHPRTAVGVDKSGRWLYLVVVDGRQPEYSIGMSARELGEVMARLGAARAANLDGGGSSILLVAKRDQQLQIINRPSGGQPRPVPVLLTIRRRAPQSN